MKPLFLSIAVSLVPAGALGQDTQSDARQRARAVRDYARAGGSDTIPKIEPYLADPDLGVRLEAVKGIVGIGGRQSIEPLVKAAADNDPEIQIRATDGLVNFYLPGYIRTGLSGTLSRAGTSIRGRFSETNDQIIESFVEVRPEVIAALGRIARGGSSLEGRANAARALGILRGREAIPDLIEALRSKDDQIIYECLVAFQKIRDPAVAERIQFLLRDLSDRVQIAALETTGILGNKAAVPIIREVVERARTPRIRRAALTALAMLPDPANRSIFLSYLANSDEYLRAAAAEGLGRTRLKEDQAVLEKTFASERRMNPRLSLAFALVSLGSLDYSEFSPLRYLVNTLNSRSYRGVAFPFLVELAREPQVRAALYPALSRATKDEKIALAGILGRSGDQATVSHLEALAKDTDPQVSHEAVEALRTLRTRLK